MVSKVSAMRRRIMMKMEGRGFSSPVSTDERLPLFGRESVEGKAGQEVAGFVSRLAEPVETIGVDANQRAQMLPAFGWRGGCSQKGSPGDLLTANPGDTDTIRHLCR